MSVFRIPDIPNKFVSMHVCLYIKRFPKIGGEQRNRLLYNFRKRKTWAIRYNRCTQIYSENRPKFGKYKPTFSQKRLFPIQRFVDWTSPSEFDLKSSQNHSTQF